MVDCSRLAGQAELGTSNENENEINKILPVYNNNMIYNVKSLLECIEPIIIN